MKGLYTLAVVATLAFLSEGKTIPSEYAGARNGVLFPEPAMAEPPSPINTEVTAKVKCPDSGLVRLPHESDCNMYYECDQGQLTVAACGIGLVFNPTLGLCDLPKNYHCEKLMIR
nr:peritrophin-1-like [Megalopta genalis]